jgi:predicted ATPase with chaperone activity
MWYDSRTVDPAGASIQTPYAYTAGDPLDRVISGPLLDRIDVQAEVRRVNCDKLTGTTTPESSIGIRKRVQGARGVQRIR